MLNTIEPYNDEEMEYIDGMYYLTLQYVKNNFETTGIRDDGVLARRIKKNTELIYDVIFDRSAKANRPVVEKVIANTREGRKWVCKLLKTQMESDLEYATNSIRDLPAINGANGQVLDRNALFLNEISVATERVLDDSDRYIGFNIMLSSSFPFIR